MRGGEERRPSRSKAGESFGGRKEHLAKDRRPDRKKVAARVQQRAREGGRRQNRAAASRRKSRGEDPIKPKAKTECEYNKKRGSAELGGGG